MLKKIEAILHEAKVSDMQEALAEIGIVGLNVFKVRGNGYQGKESAALKNPGSNRIAFSLSFRLPWIGSLPAVPATIE